jgi:phospholipase/lecithinase/hemolysin
MLWNRTIWGRASSPVEAQRRSKITNYATTPGDYVWWDSFHPTEKIHEQFAKVLWNKTPSSVGPFNLQDPLP